MTLILPWNESLHQTRHATLTGVLVVDRAEVVARREGLGKETVRRWVIQAQVRRRSTSGVTSDELAEIRELKAKVRRLEDNEILRRASIFFAGELDPRNR